MVADVRRRVQRETTGHRGHADDPQYQIRKLLLVARGRLDPRRHPPARHRPGGR